MSRIFNMDNIYFAGCLLLVCALFHLVRKRRLRRISNESKAVEGVSNEVIDDGFYCIMLSSGKCISGYKTRDE